MMQKRGKASFGTIVAIFGAVLIALGIAWLLAQNWHQIPRLIKVIILLGATIASYVAGTVLRLRKYPGIGKSLLVLGALLYTLSIFLIAQMYFTSTSFQGTAWLLLIAWIGILLTSYIFDSVISLAVALIELLIWLVVQYMAFVEIRNFEFTPGVLALILLAIGVLFYGISLWHRAKAHPFANLYRGWTAFYFLAFAYLLSFQSLLPVLGLSNVSWTAPSSIFLMVIAAIAVITLLAGIGRAHSKGKMIGKEIACIIILAILFTILISATNAVTKDVGYCDVKSCYTIRNQEECNSAALTYTECTWIESNNLGSCQEKSCSMLETKELCESAGALRTDCIWKDEGNFGASCREKNCYDYQDKKSCEDASYAKTKCRWEENSFGQTYCNPSPSGYEDLYQKCSQYTNQKEACVANSDCAWRQGVGWMFTGNKNATFSMWALWIFANLLFLAVILGVIGYGTWQKAPVLINLGIIFFALDVITRYIGFMIDFWGYTSLAIFFIVGGIILIGGGWAIEKWRKNLIVKTK